METKPPLPLFTKETATAKVQAAEDAWNTRNPEQVALAYTIEVDKVPDPKGDRVKVTMCGKFLPYKK